MHEGRQWELLTHLPLLLAGSQPPLLSKVRPDCQQSAPYTRDTGCPWLRLHLPRCRSASQGAVRRVMVVDLDVHQGNGVERDKLHWNDNDLCIVDM